MISLYKSDQTAEHKSILRTSPSRQSISASKKAQTQTAKVQDQQDLRKPLATTKAVRFSEMAEVQEVDSFLPSLDSKDYKKIQAELWQTEKERTLTKERARFEASIFARTNSNITSIRDYEKSNGPITSRGLEKFIDPNKTLGRDLLRKELPYLQKKYRKIPKITSNRSLREKMLMGLRKYSEKYSTYDQEYARYLGEKDESFALKIYKLSNLVPRDQDKLTPTFIEAV